MDDEQIHIVIKVDYLNKTTSKLVEYKEKINLDCLANIAEIILTNAAKNLHKEFPITFNTITLELVMLSSKEVDLIYVIDKKRVVIPLYVNENSFRY